MAHIRKLISERTGKVSYKVEIVTPTKRITKTFKKKTDATAFARRIEGNDILKDTLINDFLMQPFSDAYALYKEQTKDKKGMARLKNFVDVLGNIPLRSIKKSQIRRVRDSLNVADSTKNRYMNDFGTFCKWVSAESDITYRPHAGISKLTEPQSRQDYLTNQEQINLLDACKQIDKNSEWGKLYLLTLIALSTGARPGEILAIRWEDIIFNDRIITIRGEDTGASKTGRREVPYPMAVQKELMKHRKNSGLVFAATFDENQPLEFRFQWYQARRMANIPESFVFYSLRHTAASNMAAAGQSLTQIGTILGHKSTQTTLRYVHLLERETLHSITEKAMAHLG